MLADNSLWIFDQSHFKEAVTLLILNDKKEQEYNDSELKELISSQFKQDADMREWIVDLFDKVCVIERFDFKVGFRFLKIYSFRKQRNSPTASPRHQFSSQSNVQMRLYSIICLGNTTFIA